MSQYVILSDNPRCNLGYFGPYRNVEEATQYFKDMSRTDTTLQLVLYTDEQRDQRLLATLALRDAQKGKK